MNKMSRKKKPVSLYFVFLSLVIMVLIVSIDSTTLAVAIPVCTSNSFPVSSMIVIQY